MLQLQKKNIILQIDKASQIIDNALSICKNPYVSWSAGKDSTLMLYLILQRKPNIPVIYRECGGTYPMSQLYMNKLKEEWNINLIVWKSEKTILELFHEYGINNKKIEEITFRELILKSEKKYIEKYKFDGTFIGVRIEESKRRKFYVTKLGVIQKNKKNGIYRIYPLWDWKLDEIWLGYKYFNIPYNPIYDYCRVLNKNEIRVGVWCGESCISGGRWSILKYLHPELFNYLKMNFQEAGYYV